VTVAALRRLDLTGWLPQAALVLMFSAGLALAPLLALMAMCLLAATGLSGGLKYVFLLAACVLFCVLNISKEIEGDLITYLQLHQYLANASILELLNSAELRTISPTYRVTEAGFYGLLWLLGHLFGDGRAVIAVAATLAVYLSTFAGTRLMARVERWNERLTLVVMTVSFFAAVNFNLTTHLIRQHISGSLAFLAFALFLAKRRWAAVLTACVACSVHNGTALIVANVAVFGALLPYERRPRSAWQTALRILGCGLFLAASSAGAVVPELAGAALGESDISIWHFCFALVLWALFIYLAGARGARGRTAYYIGLAFCVPFLISAACFIVGFPVLALRYYVYLEWLFGAMIATLLMAIPRRYVGIYLFSRLGVCAAAMLIFLLRIQSSSWSYGPGGSRLLVEDPVSVSEYIVN